MGDLIHDTLRMRNEEVSHLLSENKERETEGASKRFSKRWAMQQQKAIVTVLEEGGVKRNLSIVPRNLSSDGVGFFHGGYMHIGTPCIVTMRTMKGVARPHKGTIVRCIHKKGRLHEVGVRFEKEIAPRDYFIDVGDAPLFNSEAVDVERLTGSALIVTPSAAERALICEYFKPSSMRICEAANAAEAFDQLVSSDPDMIFADCTLEDMGWKDLVSKLRECGFAGPVVLLSSETDQNLRFGALTAGASEVIFKPLNASIFHRAAAEYLLSTKGGTNALQPMMCELEAGSVDRTVVQQYIDELQEHAVGLHHAVKEDSVESVRKIFTSIAATAHGFGFPALGDTADEAAKVLDNPSGAQMMKLRAYEIIKMCRRAEAPLEGDERVDDNGIDQPDAEAA